MSIYGHTTNTLRLMVGGSAKAPGLDDGVIYFAGNRRISTTPWRGTSVWN
jgi:hypothetical protein